LGKVFIVALPIIQLCHQNRSIASQIKIVCSGLKGTVPF